jgi:hypothetical protein
VIHDSQQRHQKLGATAYEKFKVLPYRVKSKVSPKLVVPGNDLVVRIVL